ncbi:MAG: histidine phosphotransferase family protein [Pseudomonadota bacterium]
MTSVDPETEFASLLASRLCHDLINPAGALNTGLDVLANETDATMRQHAEDLIQNSTARLLATIEFARLAYGASGGSEGALDMAALKDVSERLYAHLKPEFHWDITAPSTSKAAGRALLNLLLCGERLAPRKGSSITVSGDGQSFQIVAAGPRAAVPDDLSAAFRGEAVAPEPKLMPAKLAARLARSAGLTISTESGDERVIVTLSMVD